MDRSLPPGLGERADEFLHRAMVVLDNCSSGLTSLLEEINEGKTERARKIAPVVGELRRASVVVLEGVKDAEERRRRAAGHVHEQAIDFTAARDEIGRRMARLRAAGGSEDLSEGSE